MTRDESANAANGVYSLFKRHHYGIIIKGDIDE